MTKFLSSRTDRTIAYLTAASFLVRFVVFLVLPFMVIYLKTLQFDEGDIGWLVGSGWVMGAIGGPVVGYLSERWSSKQVYRVTLFIWALSFLGFAYTTEFLFLFLLGLINGFCRCAVDVVLLDRMFLVVEPERRSKVATYNYIALTCAMALGPLVGAWISTSPSSSLFLWIGISLFVFILLDVIWKEPILTGERKKIPAFKDTLAVLVKDRTLFWYIMAGVVFMTVYVQIEATLPIVLQEHNLLSYYSLLLLENSVIAICFSFVIANWIHKVNGSMIMLFTSGCFFIAFVLMSTNLLICHFIGMGLISIAESFFFAIWRVKIADLGGELQATYLGTTNFSFLGFTIGAAAGGELLHQTNSVMLYLNIALLSILIFYCYYFGEILLKKKVKQDVLKTKEERNMNVPITVE